MAKRPRPWTVGAHEAPRQVEDGLWTVEDVIPGTPFRRVMVIARRGDGDLVFYNAIPLSDATLAEVASWGRPRWLAIANVFHMIDAHAFRERLGVRLLCAASAVEKARTRATVDGTFEDLPADEHVRTVSLPEVTQGETALVFTKDGRASAAFGDAFMNVPKGAGVINALLGVSGRPKACAVTIHQEPLATAASTWSSTPRSSGSLNKIGRSSTFRADLRSGKSSSASCRSRAAMSRTSRCPSLASAIVIHAATHESARDCWQ